MRYATVMTAACLILAGTPAAHAYLGGFEDVDGYESFLNDVATYNAGQYGPNAGGGTYVNIPDNTGLWTKLQGPLFPASGTTGNFAYATGHQNLDRTNPSTAAQALVITTNADGWSGPPQEYAYQLDSFDLGGVNPASTGGDIIDLSFWSCSRIYGVGEIGGGLPAGTVGNTVSFYDSSGNLGFAVGYVQPSTTTDFAAYNVNGTWVQTSETINPSTYHRWDVSLDLASQTVTIDLFNNSVLTNVVTSAPLFTSMGNFTELRFLGTPGVTNAKIWSLDDFSMSARGIPEPGTGLLMLIASMVGLLRRTR